MSAQLKATLEGVPEGAVIRLNMGVEPRTIEEFEAIVEAAGGPAVFRLGFDATSLHADVGDATLHIYPPLDCKVAQPPKGHPFVLAFAKRIEAAKGGEES